MIPGRRWATVVCFGLSGIAAAQNPLTFEDALARARARAPRILLAKDWIEEARARLLGASLRFQSNPQVDVSAGPRMSAVGNSTEYEVGISQSFELGGRRSARIAGARAEIDREMAASQNSGRELLRDVGLTFWRALAARDRLRLAQTADKIAVELLRSMERRFQEGDVPQLDVNVARVAAARTRAEVRSAEADLLATVGNLKIFLGMAPAEPLDVAGDLAAARPYTLDELLTTAMDRPDLRALAAEIRQAEAEQRLGRTQAAPDLGLAFRYERDEGDHIAKGGISLTLPVFQRGQELRAVAGAKRSRLTRQLDASKLVISNEVQTAFEVYQRRHQAAVELSRTVLPTLNESESLAQRSFEEGQLNLIELLLIRRENLETRLLHINQLLEAALAAVDLEARAGVLQ